jgi:hypothetical protein
MMRVKTRVGLSSIEGLGLFAEEPISAGQRVWEWNEIVDRLYTREELETLPEPARSSMLKYSWRYGDHYRCSGDEARFLNHSPEANLTMVGPDVEVARREIAVGEELMENYAEFDEAFAAYAATLR